MNANYYEQWGEAKTPHPIKAKMRAAEARRQKKAVIEKSILFRLWKKWRAQRQQDLRLGVYGEQVEELIKFLDDMALTDAGALVAHIKAGPWQQADKATRFEVLSLVDNYIILLREKAHMFPFEDSMPFIGAKPTVFEVLRTWLTLPEEQSR